MKRLRNRATPAGGRAPRRSMKERAGTALSLTARNKFFPEFRRSGKVKNMPVFGPAKSRRWSLGHRNDPASFPASWSALPREAVAGSARNSSIFKYLPKSMPWRCKKLLKAAPRWCTTMTMDRAEQNRGTGEVREGHAFDPARLDRWMAREVEGYAGPLTVEQFKGGQSNPTYKLVTPRRSYVLRRKPPGKLLPGAHAVDREYRVITALGQQGFPVARSYGLCLDETVIGTAFYVMEMVEGRIFWDPAFPEVPREERPAYFDAMNAALAALHRIDPDSAGLGDYGKPGNYFGRQIARWSKQYLEDVEAGRLPALDRLVEWLPGNVPPDEPEPRIIHGDYRCDNMVFHATEPRVLAVLDWELSTLGHPLADFSYHLMMYRMPDALAGRDLAALNIPPEADYVAAYCARTGRRGIADMDFYMAFNLFRLAGILHGIKGRLARGTAASAHAAEMVGRLEPLADLAWAQALKAGAA
jgi:aminoglycoside phosphotransferase (APT) family kinase protein